MMLILFYGHHAHLAGDVVDVETIGSLGTLDVVTTAYAYCCEVIAGDCPGSTPVGTPVVVGTELEFNIVDSEGVLNIPVVRSNLSHINVCIPIVEVTNQRDRGILLVVSEI